MNRTENIFGNVMPKKVVKKANNQKKKFIKKFGDDTNKRYPILIEENPCIGSFLGVQNLSIQEGKASSRLDTKKGIIVGNIRMGFGHYRISMAIASAAHAMGYTPYWMDLNSYQQTTCGKVINHQNNLYSMGSRLSQKSKLFNHFVWEPMNSEGFRKLSYNAADQKNAELMASVYGEIPKDIPVVATHVWPAQAALHAGMHTVVNAIPDNWPMALHLAEGSVHTVQTHFAYQGYRILNGMDGKKALNPMKAEELAYTGHYIDHELVANILEDCTHRIERVKNKKPMRFLLTIGGAGAQKEIFAAIIRYLLPYIKKNKAALYINVGDYKNVWDELAKQIPELHSAKKHFDNWKDTCSFADEAIDGEVQGIHGFFHSNIFEAVYATNLLMRSTDVLVTKPSELAFYPIPKLFIKRVGGHEMWGAIHSAEIGDGTLECQDIPHTLQMLKLFLEDGTVLTDMCKNIISNHEKGIYSGAYKVVELAMKGR
ncbi:DUF6937 domain-containing protein [Anaerosporobacter sp.]|uniref:DUF6937 domain-containing protein n=1 Tax=Anaerosporobacter sp. TaxID=1872529 RepID=UPI00286F2CF6|nr:hypothetical protein [Anaerosporobacter sp.]